MDLGYISLILLGAICWFGLVHTQELGVDSECYTANGIDYEGTQSVTYVKGSKVYDPTEANPEACLLWTDVRDLLNVTDFDKKLPKNYCRNPNNKLFPYCYVTRNGVPEFAYCHIPTCNTPALIGCFKLTVKEGGKAPSDANITGDVILSGTDSRTESDIMKIGRCMNFCRSRRYDYAGLTGGATCLCGKEIDDGPRMKEAINQIQPEQCLQYACEGDREQACGGDDAIAIYDVEAGACRPKPIHTKDSGLIYSPRWPGTYHNEAKCDWTIYIPDKYITDDDERKNYELRLHFTYFHLETGNDTVKLYTYRNMTDSGTFHDKFSGTHEKGLPEIKFKVSDLIAVHMIFNSDEDDRHAGFILKYEVVYVGSPTTTTVSTTTISTASTQTTSPTTAAPTTSTATSSKPSTTKSTAPGTVKSTIRPTTTLSVKRTTLNDTNVGAVSQEKSSSLGGGAIAGIVFGVLAFVALCVAGFFLFQKFRGTKESTEPQTFNNPVNFNSDSTL